MLKNLTIIIIFFAVPTLSACNSSNIDIEAEAAVLRERGEGLAAAEAAKELDVVMSYFAEGAIFQMAGAPQIEGKAEIENLTRQWLAAVKEFEGITTRIQVSSGGNLAYEYGVNREIYSLPNGDALAMGKYLIIWEKISGQWLVTALSVTNDTPLPVPLENQ